MEKRIHEGRNVKRFREMLGIKQEALAYELGDDWNQKKVSVLEQKETIDLAILKDVAAALKLPVEAFQNFDEEQAINIISNTFTSNDTSTLNAINPNCTFNINPVEKWLEAIEENKRLYERWLKEKEDTIKMLEAIIENTKR